MSKRTLPLACFAAFCALGLAAPSGAAAGGPVACERFATSPTALDEYEIPHDPENARDPEGRILNSSQIPYRLRLASGAIEEYRGGDVLRVELLDAGPSGTSPERVPELR